MLAPDAPSAAAPTIPGMPQDIVIDLDFDEATPTRLVPGCGEVAFLGAGMGLEIELAAHYDRPWRVNYRAFVNELIAGSVEPAMTAAAVDALSERSRTRLRAGVAHACGIDSSLVALRGSPLNPDERLFAAMLWHYEAWTVAMEALAAKLSVACAGHISRAAASLQPQVSRVASSILGASGLGGQLNNLMGRVLSPLTPLPASWVTTSGWPKGFPPLASSTGNIQRMVASQRAAMTPVDLWLGRQGILTAAHQDLARTVRLVYDFVRLRQDEAAFVREWESSALWFLLSLLTRHSARPLGALDREQVESLVLDALEYAVHDNAFYREVDAAVERCQMLTGSQRHHLQHGLAHAHEGGWLDASPPLLAGLEGAFWTAAHTHNVITAERALVAQPTRVIRGVESLFNRLPMPREYATFLRRRVFGTSGNEFRHGAGAGGERRQVLFGISALAGWLEAFAGEPVRHSLGSRLQLHIVQATATPAMDVSA